MLEGKGDRKNDGHIIAWQRRKEDREGKVGGGKEERRAEVGKKEGQITWLASCFMHTLLLGDCVRSWLSNAFLSLMKCDSRQLINSHSRGPVAYWKQVLTSVHVLYPLQGSALKSHAWWVSNYSCWKEVEKSNDNLGCEASDTNNGRKRIPKMKLKSLHICFKYMKTHTKTFP